MTAEAQQQHLMNEGSIAQEATLRVFVGGMNCSAATAGGGVGTESGC